MATQGRAPKAALRAVGKGDVAIAAALAAALAVGLAASPAVVAAPEVGWARVRSSRFDLLTDGGAAEALAAAAALARFDRVLETADPPAARRPWRPDRGAGHP